MGSALKRAYTPMVPLTQHLQSRCRQIFLRQTFEFYSSITTVNNSPHLSAHNGAGDTYSSLFLKCFRPLIRHVAYVMRTANVTTTLSVIPIYYCNSVMPSIFPLVSESPSSRLQHDPLFPKCQAVFSQTPADATIFETLV